MQMPSQFVVPDWQLLVHTPFRQVWPDGQEVPHIPQLELSLFVSVQTPLQFVPERQLLVHTPPWHVWPDGQAVPHIPQLPESRSRSTQFPLQLVSPARQDPGDVTEGSAVIVVWT